MGIINLSPDSFYEASHCESLDHILNTAETMISQGADILDIGAESSRPGSSSIAEHDEIKRLLPVVKRLSKELDVPISVDTYKPAVAHEVLQAGASIINDITGLQRFPEMAQTVAKHQAGMVLMHMKGSPKTMQDNPQYEDVLTDIMQYLKKGITCAVSAGIKSENIAIDPGIGFGKNDLHNLQILKNLSRLKELGQSILLGVSRKSLIGNVLDLPVDQRLEGSLAAAVFGVTQGASIIRTHDVKATYRAVKITKAIMKG